MRESRSLCPASMYCTSSGLTAAKGRERFYFWWPRGELEKRIGAHLLGGNRATAVLVQRVLGDSEFGTRPCLRVLMNVLSIRTVLVFHHPSIFHLCVSPSLIFRQYLV